jgi:protein-disulfide isomerase
LLRRLSVLAALSLLGFALSAGAPKAQESFPVDQLMASGALPDVPLGSESAPVTIVEYASMTCTHCQAFHAETWPALKVKYVDTGKAKFILREFPLDPLAILAFMAARCVGPDKRDGLIDRLFASQGDWAFRDEPIARLRLETGLSPEDFLACVKDKTLFDGITAIRDSAAQRFGINSTPTFFVNGHQLSGEAALVEFDQALAAPLK